MSLEVIELAVGQTVVHPSLGSGVVLGVDDKFARVFFRDRGEETVPANSLSSGASWEEQIVSSIRPADAESLERLRLAIEAHELPLLDSAASLTAAKVDLLPHQLVLTHKVSLAGPRRFLVADDVGLGKTIETALILRELASRGELTRALMVVPAGLVENWRRELNDVFRLDFEVFGSDGDVTDRKTNAFVKHHRLIASVDTLKRPQRMERLAEAPPWDLVVFDEAHHLTATRNGNRVKKTENYRLAEQLREHCRDLLLLSATPHQGDHFRFLTLVRLLNPSLFHDEKDMISNRHRLNAVVIRRTKADASRPDGSPLFARRQVHTQMFKLSDAEQVFYTALSDYIQDGYDLAKAKGGKARAIGFVMTIFQKIASSSFAAVRRTLERRLLSLTLHEAMTRDGAMDVSGRDALLREARAMIVEMYGLDDTTIGRAQADQHLADARVRLLKKLSAQGLSNDEDSETVSADWEESAGLLVDLALPEERDRIRKLLDLFPPAPETKTLELLHALSQIWQENIREKIIVFTTYLGGVDNLKAAIEERFGDVGVEVLKGGDHGAKTAAERRFRRPDGPKILISTAAGREGINLQFARILFNHDLPWNPMDIEQRIGRIHRYGQNDTVQVYNLVASDTIEGRVFLLLDEKIRGVAAALGKVDEKGEVAEDLRSQVLGQLGERLSFNQLYQEALRDRTLSRTAQELEVALTNANLARDVVSQLFQDLEPFRIDEFKAVDNAAGVQRLKEFVVHSVKLQGGATSDISPTRFEVALPGRRPIVLGTDRDEAMANEGLQLLGLEEPHVAELLLAASSLESQRRALFVRGDHQRISAIWEVKLREPDGQAAVRLFECATDGATTTCAPYSVRWNYDPATRPNESRFTPNDRQQLVRERMPAALRSQLVQIGALNAGTSYGARLLAWLEESAT